MKFCGRRSKMTQSRSSCSILLALVALVIVVVETSTQSTDKVENIVHEGKDDNETNYDLPIQMNFIDSELREDVNDIREVHPSDPIVIDLDHEFPNKTIPIDKVDVAAFSENEENKSIDEISIEDILTSEVQQSEKPLNETNKNVENSGQTTEAVPFVSTTVPFLDESITTLIPINETILITENTLAAVDITQVETQTQSIDLLQTSTNYDSKNHDLSIYFENEPSSARKLRGFNIETDNEVHSDSESESDSISNISTSSESEISHLSDALPGQDENKAAEDSSISEDVQNKKTTAESKTESLANIPIEVPPVEEIEAVTESTGEITNDVTVIAYVENHTIMKKPGVYEESPKITTANRSFQEQTNEVVTTPIAELDPVVNMVFNRLKNVLVPSPTTITLTENPVSDNEDTSKSTRNQLEDVVAPLAITEESNSEKSQVPVLEIKSFPETKLIDKSKQIEEDINSVDLETPSYHQDNKLRTSEQINLPDLQKSFKPHPENASNQQYDEPISGTNVIPYSEIHGDKVLENNLLIDNIETSTKAPPSIKSNEQSLLLESIGEDQQIKEKNGIFNEAREDPLNSTEKSVETSTEKSIEGALKAPLEKNHIKTIIDHHITSEDSFQTMTEKTLSSISNEEPFSRLNSIAFSETNILTDHTETSTQSNSVKSVESEPSEVQDDQTSKTNNGIFKEIDDTRLSPTDESLPDPRLYEEPVETTTEKPTIYIIDDTTTASLEKNHFGTTTDYARHVDSLQTMRDESSPVVSDEVIAPASVGRSMNEIIAQGLGKPLPTRSAGDEPSSSSYSSEDKTTTVLVLCAAAGGIFIAFSLAIYLISFQRQHGTLDIEMQEQRCGKDNLEDDDDSETRVSLLNQIPTADSDENSSD